MTDTNDDPAERPSRASGTERDSSEQGQSSTEAEGSRLGRRAFLLGSGAVGALAVGGAGAYLSLSSDAGTAEPTFLLQQGYLRYEVDPITMDETNVEEFYDYTGTSADPPEELVRDDAVSRMFLYDGPVDASLVFLHGSPTVDHGGTATFSFSGLSRDQGEWAVRDDPASVSDDFAKWDGGNQKVQWEWGADTTDGGAYWGVLDRSDFTITVTPKTLRGVDDWRFLSGELGQLNRYDLSREKPVSIRPARGRTVKRANVEIMPNADTAAFDPYANETMTVAVNAPPAGVDESEWVQPADLDPGNYAVNFGSKRYLAGQNAAQPQKYVMKGGSLYLQYKTSAANFSLDSAYGYLVSKVGEKTFVRGKDVVRPGGFDNAERESAQLVVSDLHVDPEGDDRDRLAAEYVEFANDGDEPLDVSNYTIRDESGAAFAVPDDTAIEPDQRVRLHTGSGESTATEWYWGRDRPVWNNDGDTVVVLDEDANTVLEYTYPRA